MKNKKAITELIYKSSKDTEDGILIDYEEIENLINKLDALFSLKDVSNCAIEQAKIEATKRIKMVVEVALQEYTTALNNGRCDECGDPLAKGEKATCEDCLCPE